MKKFLVLFLPILMLITFDGCFDSPKDDEEDPGNVKIINNDIQTVTGFYYRTHATTA